MPRYLSLVECECTCPVCVNNCKGAPCIGTPEEMQAIIDAGLGHNLIAAPYQRGRREWLLVGPDVLSKDLNPLWPQGRCVFLDNNDRCQLHDRGLKPLEGRVANCSKQNPELRGYVAAKWHNPKAQKRIADWLKTGVIRDGRGQ